MSNSDIALIWAVAILCILFWGTPDLMDAIIYALTGGSLVQHP